MRKTTAGGRELFFYWDLEAWFEVEEKLGSIETLTRRVTGNNEQPAGASAVLICASANAGFRRQGLSDRIDEEWLKKSVGCGAFKRMNALAREAYITGMRREEAQEENEEPVDVVAAEIKKKRNPGRSMRARQCLGCGLIAGLTMSESLSSPPGLIFDLFFSASEIRRRDARHQAQHGRGME